MATREDFVRLGAELLYVVVYFVAVGLVALLVQGAVYIFVMLGLTQEDADHMRELSHWLVQLDKYGVISAALLGTIRALVNLAGRRW